MAHVLVSVKNNTDVVLNETSDIICTLGMTKQNLSDHKGKGYVLLLINAGVRSSVSERKKSRRLLHYV
jgi:hypothetical protein